MARNGMDRVGDFALLDHEGRHHQLYRYIGSSAVVLFVYGSDCNIARDSIPALKQLRQQVAEQDDGFLMKLDGFLMNLRERFAKQGDSFLMKVGKRFASWGRDFLIKSRERFPNRSVSFLMIDANSQDDRKTLQKDAVRYGIDMPILRDESQLVAENLDIYRTGEALLIDTRTWQVVYRGPVDDRLYYEFTKDGPQQHFLRDAIEALLDGRAVGPATPPAIGCHISLDKKKEVSYSKQVAPILLEKCVSCHQAGGIAPWAMDRYDRVKGWSAMMREVLMNRRMPPWQADPAIGSFSNDRSLSVEQTRTLVHWIDAGAPRGEGPDLLSERKAQIVPEWPLGGPDLVIDVPEQQIPASGAIDFRYVEIPLPFDRDVWVRAVHLKPSNRAVMHHAFALIKLPPQSGVPEQNGLNSFFAAYAPSLNVEPFPRNSGQLLRKGTVLRFELHYTAVGYNTTDRPKLAIYLHKRPPSRELVVASAWNLDLRIPPYAADHPVEAKFVFDQDAVLHALLPHMHYRGSRASYEARYPDGRGEMLLSVPRFRFNWQSLYNLRTPKPIPAKTELVVRGAFNNSRSNPTNPDPSKEVRYGPQSWDEMFIGYVLYTVPRRSGPR
jgi:peroxiredoxin